MGKFKIKGFVSGMSSNDIDFHITQLNIFNKSVRDNRARIRAIQSCKYNDLFDLDVTESTYKKILLAQSEIKKYKPEKEHQKNKAQDVLKQHVSLIKVAKTKKERKILNKKMRDIYNIRLLEEFKYRRLNILQVIEINRNYEPKVVNYEEKEYIITEKKMIKNEKSDYYYRKCDELSIVNFWKTRAKGTNIRVLKTKDKTNALSEGRLLHVRHFQGVLNENNDLNVDVEGTETSCSFKLENFKEYKELEKERIEKFKEALNNYQNEEKMIELVENVVKKEIVRVDKNDTIKLGRFCLLNNEQMIDFAETFSQEKGMEPLHNYFFLKNYCMRYAEKLQLKKRRNLRNHKRCDELLILNDLSIEQRISRDIDRFKNRISHPIPKINTRYIMLYKLLEHNTSLISQLKELYVRSFCCMEKMRQSRQIRRQKSKKRRNKENSMSMSWNLTLNNMYFNL